MRDEEGSGEERGELDQKWDERDPRPKTPKHDEVEDDARRVERTKAREFSERQDDFAVNAFWTSKPSPMQQAPLAARKDAHRQRAMRTSLPLALALLATGLGCHKRLVLVDADSTPVGSVAKPVSTGSEASERVDKPHWEVTRTPDAGRGTSRMALTDASNRKAAATQSTEPYPPTCAGTCEKTLRCIGAFSAGEQATCVAQCQAGTPDPARFARLNTMDCATLAAALKGERGSGSARGNGGDDEACGAQQCATCVFDGTSCYSRVPPFLACDACCCRAGGPAPRWD